MNSTSRSSRLVSSAARSPALAMTGPEVARKFTPSSRATICASVVLPSPGGPTNSTWSSASPRVRAAAMNTPRLARACCWPMNSDSRCGRSDGSPASSSRRSGVTRRRGVVGTERSSKNALAAVLVGQQVADGRYDRPLRARHDDTGVAVVIPDQFAAASAGRNDVDGLIWLIGIRMAHRHDRLDVGLAGFGYGAAQGDCLRAYGHAAEIGIEIDAREDASGARAQR